MSREGPCSHSGRGDCGRRTVHGGCPRGLQRPVAHKSQTPFIADSLPDPQEYTRPSLHNATSPTRRLRLSLVPAVFPFAPRIVIESLSAYTSRNCFLRHDELSSDICYPHIYTALYSCSERSTLRANIFVGLLVFSEIESRLRLTLHSNIMYNQHDIERYYNGNKTAEMSYMVRNPSFGPSRA